MAAVSVITRHMHSVCLASLLLLVAMPPHGWAEELKKSASWDWPEVGVFEQHLASFLDQNEANDDLRSTVEQFWTETAADVRGPNFLDRLFAAAAMIDARLEELAKQHADYRLQPVAPGQLDWLTTDIPGWLQDTVRLGCGRAFAQRQMYDEALEALEGLQLNQVCDPSSLIFYRAICEHHLLKQDECVRNVELLLERESEIPARFSQLAVMIKADIEPLKEDSLDEVARLMRDVERRLDLGRAGTRVRDEEQKIVDKLDKLIEDIEQQLQKQKQAARQESNGSQQSPSPMEDSQIAGGSGPGDVDNTDSGDRSGWGNLPPAERQEALQRLTEELPSHYRDVIEGYFRELAKGAR